MQRFLTRHFHHHHHHPGHHLTRHQDDDDDDDDDDTEKKMRKAREVNEGASERTNERNDLVIKSDLLLLLPFQIDIIRSITLTPILQAIPITTLVVQIAPLLPQIPAEREFIELRYLGAEVKPEIL